MPILVLFAWQGQPDSLVAAYHREMADAPSVTFDQPQRTLHVFAAGPRLNRVKTLAVETLRAIRG